MLIIYHLIKNGGLNRMKCIWLVSEKRRVFVERRKNKFVFIFYFNFQLKMWISRLVKSKFGFNKYK